MSPSDLKYIDMPIWIDPTKGRPTLMLFSVVDDRSGVAYVEYRCVYGEDAESALRFLFNAMTPKSRSELPCVRLARPRIISVLSLVERKQNRLALVSDSGSVAIAKLQ